MLPRVVVKKQNSQSRYRFYQSFVWIFTFLYLFSPESALAGRLYPAVYRASIRAVTSGTTARQRSNPRLGGSQRNYESRIFDWRREEVRYQKLIADREYKLAKLEARQEELATKKAERERAQRKKEAERLRLAQLRAAKKSSGSSSAQPSGIQQDKNKNRQTESLLFSGEKFDSKQPATQKPSFWQRLMALFGFDRKR